ncbi:MAG: hypothetical protein KDB45_07770, partial [Mycobacterium sp.]|nr:hypothetical protein [Mycobacterium sp.]
MQISLRSRLIAGTAAVVGASAIATTPVTAASLNLPAVQAPSLSQVGLRAFVSPLSELLNTTVLTTNYLFNTTSDPTVAASWPFADLSAITAGALSLPAAGGYSSVGVIPQIIDDALPIISQLGYNGSDYLQAISTELYAAGYYLSQGTWDAVGELLSLDITGALDTFVGAFIQAGSALITGAGYVLTGVINRATAVLETVVALVPVLLESTLKQIQVVGDSVGAVFNNFINAFSGPNPIEGAWNAVVEGLLGPSGIPGTLVNLTVGAGVGATLADFVPSIRTEVQAGVKAIAGALATPVASSAAAVEAPAAAAVEAAPAADEAVAAAAEAPAAEAPAAEAAAPEAAASDDKAEAAAAAGASEAA